MTRDERRRVDGSHRRALGAIAVLLAGSAAIGSCTWMPDAVNPLEWYQGAKVWVGGDGGQDQKAESTAKPIPGADKPFPKLSTVPERPTADQRAQAAAERKRVASTLAADRSAARYTDEVIRRQGEAAPPPQPAVRAAVAPAPDITPPALPAPPAAAVTPVSPPPPPIARAPQVARTPPARATRRLPGTPSGPRPAPAFAALEFGAAPADIAAGLGGGASAAGPAPGLGFDAGNMTTVYFASGSARLGAKGRRGVRRAFRAYRARGGTLRVVGHASSRTRDLDPFSHQLVNFNVSVDRANAVARELIRLGVKPEAVRVDAVSDTQPVYFEVMPSGEAGNRRTEIFLER